MPRMYLARHELESVIIIIIITGKLMQTKVSVGSKEHSESLCLAQGYCKGCKTLPKY